MNRALGFMEFALYRQIIDEIATFREPTRSKEIELFHFGESLLHPELAEMVQYASGRGLRAVLSVNAPHLSPELAEKILASNPHRVIVSLDGHDRETYMMIRGRSADFDRAISNTEALIGIAQRLGVAERIVLRMIKLKANENQAETFLQYWKKRGVSVELRTFFPWTEQSMEALGDFQKYPPGMPCPFPWQYLVVQWDGTVVPCCRDYNAVNAIGNIRTVSLRELWNSMRYARFREMHATGRYEHNTFCGNCMEMFSTAGKDDKESTSARYTVSSENVGHLTAVLAPHCIADLQRGVFGAASIASASKINALEHFSPDAARVLMLAARGFSLRESADIMSISATQVYDYIAPSVATGMLRLEESLSTDSCKSRAATQSETICALWRWATDAFQDAPLLVLTDDGTSLSYGEAASLVTRISCALSAGGITKGQRIAVCATLRPEVLLLFWGAASLGAVFIPVDPACGCSFLEKIIENATPSILFCEETQAAFLNECTGLPCVVFDETGEDSVCPCKRFSSFLDMAGQSSGEFSHIVPEDPAVILYTSGTSGFPKGVVLSHGALFRSGRLMADAYAWCYEDLLFSLAEIHTMSGLRNPGVAAVAAGAAILVAPMTVRSNVLTVTKEIQRHRVTIVNTVPAMIHQFNRMRDRIPPTDLRTLRYLMCTGSAMSPEASREFMEHYAIEVLNYYGLTETCGLCIGVLPGQAKEQSGSIGLPLECIAAIVMDDGSFADDDSIGRLMIWSENLMSGYFRNARITGEAMQEGWLKTGDLAFRRRDGSIVLVERESDSIKDSRGELIHPREIEEALEQHELVAEAGVCGYRDEAGTERLGAFIVPARDGDSSEMEYTLRSFLLQQVGPRKIPSFFLFLGQLPHGTNGKLLRRKLRELIPS